MWSKVCYLDGMKITYILLTKLLPNRKFRRSPFSSFGEVHTPYLIIVVYFIHFCAKNAWSGHKEYLRNGTKLRLIINLKCAARSRDYLFFHVIASFFIVTPFLIPIRLDVTDCANSKAFLRTVKVTSKFLLQSPQFQSWFCPLKPAAYLNV